MIELEEQIRFRFESKKKSPKRSLDPQTEDENRSVRSNIYKKKLKKI